ncbi:MAG: 4Fe-4S binding protein [Campylobacterota bacterium]|nr:4Fe-4S binding protein [Campylobacterota bacterium]
MVNANFLQKSNLFSYDATSCLRNDYFFNSCEICVDICSKNAFNIVRNKLQLFENECIECAACIGSCPTEALNISSFDANEYTQNITTCSDEIVSCKKGTPCLGVFDRHHFISMVLLKNENITCSLSECSECTLNSDEKMIKSIENKIDESNEFLDSIGFEHQVIKSFENAQDQNDRRMIFKKAFNSVTDSKEKKKFTLTQEYRSKNQNGVPLKYIILKDAIKSNLEAVKNRVISNNNNIFFDKTIEFKSCTNCGDCIKFCPTNALSATKDNQGIIFQQSTCIGCGVCEHICKTNAITTPTSFDLVEIAYDRAKELVHYEMVMCHECRTPYPYRGGDPICDRCESFLSNSPGMFTMAKDL